MDANFANTHLLHESQRRKRQHEAEEEQMTAYSNEELKEDWEFKILRCQFGEFGTLASRQLFLDAEAVAGWKLVEVLDENRMRLKRPASAKENDRQLDFDPYRVTVCHAWVQSMSTVVIWGSVAVIGVVMIFVFGSVVARF